MKVKDVALGVDMSFCVVFGWVVGLYICPSSFVVVEQNRLKK
jgi:hypothetical protein